MARLAGVNKKTAEVLSMLKSILDPANPTTKRFVFYRLVSLGVFANSLPKYNAMLATIRNACIRGEIDDACFVDNKRVTHHVSQWAGLPNFMSTVRSAYRRDYWADQDKHVCILVEKGTVGEVLRPITDEYGIRLHVSAGYNSRSFLCSIAESIAPADKETCVGYVGDFDPNGLDIERSYRRGNDSTGARKREGLFDILENRFDFDCSRIQWSRLALTEDDLTSLNASQKVKVKAGSSLSPKYKQTYGDFGAEVEALDQTILRAPLQY